MGKFKALSLASVFAVGAAGIANAADYLPPAPYVEAPMAIESEFSGWYLRGDVGIGLDRNIGLRSTPDPLTQGGVGFIPTNYQIVPASVSGTPFIGFGFGYKMNNWFRADVTAEYRTATFSAQDQLTWNNGAQFFVLRNFYRGNLSTMVALFNGYIDMGTWSGLTPYVGAGFGAARSRISGMTDNGYQNLYAGPGAFATSNTSGTYRTSNSTSFAWALMAGVSYDVNARLKLEMGYRYLNIGKVKSASPACNAAGPGVQACSNIALEMKRSGTHDFRIGMRWMLSDAAPARFAAPAPIVRKY